MADTLPDKFKGGYGDKAYEHAKPSFHGGPKEQWTHKTEKVNEKRFEEYAKRYSVVSKKHKLQTVKELLGLQTEKKFTFKSGDTLYSALKDFFGMNEHTAFFCMMRMLHDGLNIDLWNPGDVIELRNDGTIYGEKKSEGSSFSVEVDKFESAPPPKEFNGETEKIKPEVRESDKPLDTETDTGE